MLLSKGVCWRENVIANLKSSNPEHQSQSSITVTVTVNSHSHQSQSSITVIKSLTIRGEKCTKDALLKLIVGVVEYNVQKATRNNDMLPHEFPPCYT